MAGRPRLDRALSRLASACVIGTLATAALSAVAWAVNWLVLARIRAGYIPMAPSTALLFITLCVCWLVYSPAGFGEWHRSVARGGALLTLVACSVIVLDYVAGGALDVERLLLAHPPSFGAVMLGRMSPITAVAFLLAAGSLLTMTRRSSSAGSSRDLASVLATAVFAIGVVVCIGYLYAAPLLYGSTVIPVALTTGLAFVLLGMGLVFSCGASSWPIRPLVGNSVQTRLLRVFLPVILGIVLLHGWLGAIIVPRAGNPAVTSAMTFLLALLVVVAAVTRLATGIGSQIDRAIAERDAAAATLTKSEEKYRSFFNDDLAADYISTADGRIQACNPAFLRIFGLASMEEAGATSMEAFYRDPQDYQELLSELRERGRLESREVEMVRRDGAQLVVLANFMARFDSAGSLQEIKGYLIDETKRRELERQLMHAQKMEGLGTLAAGIAHDFNNILSIILGNAVSLKERASEPSRVSECIEAISTAAQRAVALVRQLLTFARKADAVIEPVDINASVREINRLVSEAFPRTVAVALDLTEDLPPIAADPNQIHLALLNLCVNARDAMPGGGTLSISTALAPGELVRERIREAEQGVYVLLEIGDTGHGMDEETRNRVFEPFFTTKGHGKGTGLGLAVVYGIVEAHRGFVDVESKPEAGTVFRIYLPASAGVQVEAEPRAEGSWEPSGGSEAILVVEDEEMLRPLVAGVLRSRGYATLVACDGEEAINLFVDRRDEIALILTDLGMPKLGGEELVRRLISIDPNAKIIVASGYFEPAVRSELERMKVAALIQKPYRPEELVRIVRKVLDEKRQPESSSQSA
ncbi:MAG: response regulator [Acidobacteria bacterium]|nr:response regulator [Acidobacteriota bacterium]